MIPRLKPSLSKDELIAASSFWGKTKIEDFERAFAKLQKAKYALAFPYGRTGLMLAIEALDLVNVEIICPAYTCIVVAHAIVKSDNIPVFVDSELDSFNMDWELVERAITEKTGAIIATSIFGYPVDLDAVQRIKARYPKIRIIQDCAHSFAAEWNGKAVQSVGDCAIFGLNISKLMTSIFGGMVLTDNIELYGKLKELRSRKLVKPSILKSLKLWLYLNAVYFGFNSFVYSFVNRCERSGLLEKFVSYYDENLIDMPKDYLEEMRPIQARVGIVQCGKYQKIIAHRRRIASLYHKHLKKLTYLTLPKDNFGVTYSHYVIKTKDAYEIINYFRCNGIQLGELIDYHIPSMLAYKNHRYFSNGNSESWPGNVINLPVHGGVTENVVLQIATYLENFFSIQISRPN